MNAADLLGCLAKVRHTGPNRWLACCPAHSDRSPSLSIRECDDGRILVHCFAGCPVEKIVSDLGLTLSDLMPPKVLGDRIRGERMPIKQAMQALSFQASVVALCAADVGRGKVLSEDEREMLMVCASQIQEGIALCN